MLARFNPFQGDPGNLDKSERFAEQKIVPQLQRVPGFLGVLSRVDRASGESLAIISWESEAAMRSCEPDADRVRGQLKQPTGDNVVGVQPYEASLRVGV